MRKNTSTSAQASEKIRERDLPRWLTIGGPVFAVLFLASVFGFYFFNFHGELANQSTWGQFGDFVGGVLNPLFGFLAFLLLLATLILQNRELQLSTQELAKSAKALNIQNETLSKQNFENTFFQMLRRISELVSQATRTPPLGHVGAVPANGRGAFEMMFKGDLRKVYNELALTPDPVARVERAYQKFYSEKRGELGHYFRSLYHLFTFIDRSDLSEQDKSQYANIVRAQLSTYELCLLFYNGVWGEGKAGFKPLVEKYGILKHLDPRDLLDRAHMDNRDFYQPTAFMGREERQKYTV